MADRRSENPLLTDDEFNQWSNNIVKTDKIYKILKERQKNNKQSIEGDEANEKSDNLKILNTWKASFISIKKTISTMLDEIDEKEIYVYDNKGSEYEEFSKKVNKCLTDIKTLLEDLEQMYVDDGGNIIK